MFDPKRPKKLTIFAAAKYPAWQEKYVELLRSHFDALSMSVNDKELNPKVSKMGEMKKAMPFIQALKRRLQGGEKPEAVFERKLAFDEFKTLEEMVPGLRKTTGCKSIVIVAVDDEGKVGKIVAGDADGTMEGLPPVAQGAVPGNPTFYFENLDG
jgi:leucyl-tRNA synthetase